MSDVNLILNGLQKVRATGKGKWIACCPVHGDKSPSLGITQKDEDKILIHCFGCGASGPQVCEALGVDPAALFPATDKPKYERQPRSGFSAWQLLHALEKDLLVVQIATTDFLINGKKPCQEDANFLAGVCERISEGLEYLEGAR